MHYLEEQVLIWQFIAVVSMVVLAYFIMAYLYYKSKFIAIKFEAGNLLFNSNEYLRQLLALRKLYAKAKKELDEKNN